MKFINKLMLICAICCLVCFSGCTKTSTNDKTEPNPTPAATETVENTQSEIKSEETHEIRIIEDIGNFYIVENVDDSNISKYSFAGKEAELTDWKKQILQDKLDQDYFLHGYFYNDYNFISAEYVEAEFSEELIEQYFENKVNAYPTEFGENNLGTILTNHEIIEMGNDKVLKIEVVTHSTYDEDVYTVETEGVEYNYIQESTNYEYSCIKSKGNITYLLVYQCAYDKDFEETKANVFFENFTID